MPVNLEKPSDDYLVKAPERYVCLKYETEVVKTKVLQTKTDYDMCSKCDDCIATFIFLYLCTVV